MIKLKEYTGGINGIPQYQDRKEMWEALHIEAIQETSPSIDEFVRHLSEYYTNGSVKYGCFKLGDSDIFDWYSSRNQLKEMLFFWRIWEQEPIKKFFELNDINENSNKQFEWTSPFILGGTLAWVLSRGGAYKRPSWGGENSKAIGESAALDLIGNNYDDSLVFESHTAWCDYFYDVAWDYTYVVLNKKTRVLHIMIATGTD